ncbi:UNVERIFIED_CONTAM: chloride channel protein [Streptococcus canis]|uniref:chloride channel protein n=1 Tax=Streptococcus canis TaxID=1329 RepID=UPI0013D92EE2|nr:chloride channel protein [Streptococcus canis]QKG75850.1 chloride channel protein [Streptococcus canis]
MIKSLSGLPKPQIKRALSLIGLALPIGLLVGMVDAIFGKGLLLLSAFRDQHLLCFLPFLALVGLGISWLYETFGKEVRQGMGLVFEVGHGQKDKIPPILIPLILVTTWLTHLFGASAGREGVAVQIGATISHYCQRFVKTKDLGQDLLVIGMAAGFAGLFQTPIAAVVFALEVLLLGTISYTALLPSLVAAYLATWTSHALGLEKFTVFITDPLVLTPLTLVKLMGLGFVFGLVGNGFAYLLASLKSYFGQKLPNLHVRIALIGAFLSIALFMSHYGRYSGLGTNLINASFFGHTILAYDWMLKALLTALTLSAGFQGGEVTPLFSIGASLGVVLAPYLDLPVLLVAALGYVTVFGSATNTFWTPVFIGIEVFGSENVLAYFVTSATAYMVSRKQSIYSYQKVFVAKEVHLPVEKESKK